jgi:hypothetical protein
MAAVSQAAVDLLPLPADEHTDCFVGCAGLVEERRGDQLPPNLVAADFNGLLTADKLGRLNLLTGA